MEFFDSSISKGEQGTWDTNFVLHRDNTRDQITDDVNRCSIFPPDFEILGKLGTGGMGTVWRARPRSGQREVALKLLNSVHLNSEVANRRFEREIEVASLLEHPNIARVYDSDLSPGVYFYSMELIDGVSLDEFVERNRLSRRASLALMGVVCRAIQYAHQKGVIHRDLKPSNIMVDRNGAPHIVDFGLGKLIDDVPFSTISLVGDCAGTPAYMSPEQAAGRVDEIGTRSDIYSLGVILYQLMTGRLPHDLVPGKLSMLEQIAKTEILRPRLAARDIDRNLESLLLKSLAKDPNERYGSVGELAADIGNYLNGEPLIARRHTAAYFFYRKIVKFRYPISVAAAVIAVIVGILINDSIRITTERNAALTSANKAEVERHVSQINLADSLISNADNMARDGRWREVGKKYWDAYQIQAEEHVSTINATLALLKAGRYAPSELSKFLADAQSPLAPIGVIPDPEARTAWAVLPGGIAQSYDLITGRPVKAYGKQLPRGLVLSVFPCSKGAYFYRLVGQQGTSSTASCEIQKINLRDGSEQRVFSFGGFPSFRTAMLPDGSCIALLAWMAHPDNRPRIWSLWVIDAASPTPVLLEPHGENIKSIAFSPDGRYIAAGDSQGHVRLWDAAAHAELRSVNINSGEPETTRSKDISELIYSPGGDGLLIGCGTGAVEFVAISTAAKSRHLGDSDSRIGALAYSHDGSLALAGDDNGNIFLWNAASGELLNVYGTGSGIVSVSFSADDGTILISSRNGTIRVWPVELNDHSTLYVSPKPAGCLAVSPDDLLAAIGTSNDLNVVDIATGRRISHATLSGKLVSLAFSADGAVVTAASDDGAIIRMDVYQQCRQLDGCPPGTHFRGLDRVQAKMTAAPLKKVLILPNTDTAIDFTYRGLIFIDVVKGQRTRVIDGAFLPVGAMSTDGRSLLAVTSNPFRELKIVDIATGSVQSIRLDQYHLATAIGASRDFNVAYLATDDDMIRAIDLRNGEEIWSVSAGQQGVISIQVPLDDAVMFTDGRDGTLRLRSTLNGADLRMVSDGKASSLATALSPRGDILLSANGATNSVAIWNLSLPSQLHELEAEAISARARLRRDESSTPAIGTLLNWFSLEERSEWGKSLLDGRNIDAALGISAARFRWQTGEIQLAATDFNDALNRHLSGFSPHYLQACRDAAGGKE